VASAEETHSRYWPALIVGQERLSLSHLDPHDVHCPTRDPQLPDPLLIGVRYSDHCFSAGFDPTRHPPEALLWQRTTGQDRRVFDPDRYLLSHALPGLITGLSAVRVNFTSEARNFVYAAQVVHEDMSGAVTPYGIFFQLRRARSDERGHLALHVVSAYRPDRGVNIRHDPRHIRFQILAGKVFRGEKILPPRR
jgi:hypothetical protein